MGWHTNRYCLGGLPTVYLDARERTKLVLERMRYEAHELAGQNLHKVPNPPDVDYVTPRLGECYDTSGEKYLYAKELGWENGFSLLGFIWGGTNQPQHARDRITLIEDGIRKNGIFGMRLGWSSPKRLGPPTIEYFPTNQCAIVRDTKGLVKIPPLDCLQSYVDAGLVKLPKQNRSP